MSDTADLLDRTAELVEREGLLRGRAWNGSTIGLPGYGTPYAGGPMCTVGALRVAQAELDLPVSEVDIAAEAALEPLGIRNPSGFHAVVALGLWNDHHSTRELVVDGLRHAAKDIRNGG